jgi:Brp/Blh family beta-carotene 15,15'-monooxygenase
LKTINKNIIELYSFSILGSFFALWLSVQIEPAIESMIAYVMILSLGILHGSNDVMLVNHTLKSELNISTFTIFLSYILLVLFVAVLFYFIPILALSLFVLFSAYHFGEQHFHLKSNSNSLLVYLYYLIYGMLIFSMLFFFNQQDVINVVFEITDYRISNQFLIILFYFSVSLTVLLTLYLGFIDIFKLNYFHELVLLIIMLLVFSNASLIAGFAIYFILWHSIPSLKDQIVVLHKEFNKQNVLLYLKNSFLYWLISITSLFGLYYFLDNDKLFISMFFSFLAAITFPHVIVMFNLFNKKTQIDK